MKKNLGLRKSWWRSGCGSNKKDEQMDGHEVGIEIGLLEKALVQFTASIPLTLFVSTSGLKKEFKAKREIDPVFPCHTPPPPTHPSQQQYFTSGKGQGKQQHKSGSNYKGQKGQGKGKH